MPCRVGRAEGRAILTDCGEEHDGEPNEHGDVVSDPGTGTKRPQLRRAPHSPWEMSVGCGAAPEGEMHPQVLVRGAPVPPSNTAEPTQGHSSAPQPVCPPQHSSRCLQETKKT